VVAAGGSNNDSRGYYVVIRNDSNDPNKAISVNNRIITRYLHLSKAPSLIIDNRIKKGDFIGYVGKTGSQHIGNQVNHLHIDFNSSGYITTGVPYSVGIFPMEFWPNVSFRIDNNPQ
jgi:murein DD-endopeptidase MepM/ murein hydrolase activator NlpD